MERFRKPVGKFQLYPYYFTYILNFGNQGLARDIDSQPFMGDVDLFRLNSSFYPRNRSPQPPSAKNVVRNLQPGSAFGSPEGNPM